MQCHATSVMVEDVSTSMPDSRMHACIRKHKQARKLASHTSPALDDGAAVGVEVTAAEGAGGDTGIAVDNIMSRQSCHVSHGRGRIHINARFTHACMHA